MKYKQKIFIMVCFFCVLTGCQKSGVTQETGLTKAAEAVNVDKTPQESGEMGASTGIDVAIVMDTSGSMVASDKDRISIEAAKMFVDMEKTVDVNLALMEFSDGVRTEGLLPINNQENKEVLKGKLDKITYVNNAETDTGAALKEAVSLLATLENDHKKTVVLFTDGCTQVSNGMRTTEQSMTDVTEAVQSAAEKGFPIYTVGLNSDGSVNEDQLRYISGTSSGKTLIATEVSQLPSFFNEIFKDLGNIKEIQIGDLWSNGMYQSVEIPIENDNIMEANIVILSDIEIEDLRLYEPDTGAMVTFDQKKYVFTSSSRYSLVKLVAPESGIWRLEVKGVTGHQIRISLIYNYDANLIVSVSQKEALKGDEIGIEAFLSSDGKLIKDNPFYEKMEGKAYVTSDTGQTEEVFLSAKDGGMKGTFPVSAVSDYTIKVHLEGQGLYRDSEEICLKVINRPMEEKKKLDKLVMKPGEEKTWNGSEYFTDPDEEAVVYTVSVKDENIAEALTEGGQILCRALEAGKTELVVTATDAHGSKSSQTITLECSTFMSKYQNTVLVGGLILLLLMAILIVVKLSRRANGYFIVQIEERNTTQQGQIKGNNYKIVNGIPVQSLGRAFTLAYVLNKFLEFYRSIYGQERMQNLTALVMSVKGPASSVKFTATGDKKRIKVLVKGKNTVFCDITGNAAPEKKSMIISYDAMNSSVFYIRINKADAENYVLVKIEYSIESM